VNDCTAGLHLALAALGLGPGHEVIMADYSFPGTGHAVLYCGATPVFVDVRADTGTIDPHLVEAGITSRTRAIVAADALGVPADWCALEQAAWHHGLFLVEDAASSAGGSYRDHPCGSFGEVAVFSLDARKGIICGEGGVVTTDDAALAARYAELLAEVPGIELPSVPPDRSPTWQTYAVTVHRAATPSPPCGRTGSGAPSALTPCNGRAATVTAPRRARFPASFQNGIWRCPSTPA
jgi:dTDP-4-amino-4,6-dideoxygalactose transaminase